MTRGPQHRGPHQAIRRALLPYAYGSPCPLCGRVMVPGQPLDLDHNPDRVGYRGMAHASCNRSDGARRGNAKRRESLRMRKVAALMADEIALAVSISEDRRHTSVCVAAQLADGPVLVDLVRYLDGVASALSEILEVWRGRKVLATVVDPHSPAATLIRPLREARVEVVEPSVSQVGVAHNGFRDRLDAGRLRHTGRPELTAAVRHGSERRLGGASAWNRRGVDVDVSPVEAAELAVWGLVEIDHPRPIIAASGRNR